MNEKIQECYRILGLPLGTLMPDVQRRCMELSEKWHPDKFLTADEKQDAWEMRRRVQNAANWLLEFSLYGTSRLHPEDPEKQLELGDQYLAWALGPQDYHEAVVQYRKAADQGYLHAQFVLFEIFGDGLLLPNEVSL